MLSVKAWKRARIVKTVPLYNSMINVRYFQFNFSPDFIMNPSFQIHVKIDASVKARQISWKKFKFSAVDPNIIY